MGAAASSARGGGAGSKSSGGTPIKAAMRLSMLSMRPLLDTESSKQLVEHMKWANTFIEMMPLPICLIDYSGIIYHVNDEFNAIISVPMHDESRRPCINKFFKCAEFNELLEDIATQAEPNTVSLEKAIWEDNILKGTEANNLYDWSLSGSSKSSVVVVIGRLKQEFEASPQVATGSNDQAGDMDLLAQQQEKVAKYKMALEKRSQKVAPPEHDPMILAVKDKWTRFHSRCKEVDVSKEKSEASAKSKMEFVNILTHVATDEAAAVFLPINVVKPSKQAAAAHMSSDKYETVRPGLGTALSTTQFPSSVSPLLIEHMKWASSFVGMMPIPICLVDYKGFVYYTNDEFNAIVTIPYDDTNRPFVGRFFKCAEFRNLLGDISLQAEPHVAQLRNFCWDDAHLKDSRANELYQWGLSGSAKSEAVIVTGGPRLRDDTLVQTPADDTPDDRDLEVERLEKVAKYKLALEKRALQKQLGEHDDAVAMAVTDKWNTFYSRCRSDVVSSTMESRMEFVKVMTKVASENSINEVPNL
jgi:hypothetical protein